MKEAFPRTSERADPRYTGPRPPFNCEIDSTENGSTDALTPQADHGEKTYCGSGRLRGSVALVVGGDSGIGRAISVAFAREGADVAFTYHSDEEDASATQQLLSHESNIRSQFYQLDQSNADACRQLLEQVIEDFGKLDLLVNNAAIQKTYETLEAIDISEFEQTFRTNAFGTFYLCKNAIELMEVGGSIINTASIQSYDPGAYLLPYAATKASIANMTKSFAEFAIEKGIRVNAVAPGPVWTPLIPGTMPADKVEHFGSSTVLGRPAQPAELAPIYVFLASEEASFVTGEIYPVTGGRRQL